MTRVFGLTQKIGPWAYAREEHKICLPPGGMLAQCVITNMVSPKVIVAHLSPRARATSAAVYDCATRRILHRPTNSLTASLRSQWHQGSRRVEHQRESRAKAPGQ